MARDNISKDKVYAQETSSTFVHLLTVNLKKDNGQIEIYRFCDQFVNVTSRGDIFLAASFKLTLGTDSAENLPQVNLEFDSGDRQIIRALRENAASPMITLEVVLGENPNIVEIGPMEYQVLSFEFNDSSVNMRLGVEPVLDGTIPRYRFTPQTASGLFANIPA